MENVNQGALATACKTPFTVSTFWGNLKARTDSAAGLNESFGYDNLNRLTSTPQGSVSYDAAGNIQQREGKSYSYVSGSHRMQSMGGRSYQYDANGNVVAIHDAENGNQTLTYGIQNLPDAIQKGSTTLSYDYNPGNQRLRETAVIDQGVTVTWYLGGFEVKHNQDGGIEERHYLASPEGAIGIHTRTYGEAGQGISAGSRTRYWIKDHLGSVTAIADEQGSLVQRYRFDAWGRRTQTQLAGGEIAEERGYTGHEQMTEVDLIHMNGRIYDPATGRMLQADPIIQSPYDGQNYNRYSYVLNNPLSLTDPTGFSFWSKIKKPLMMIAVAVAAYFTAGAALAYFGIAGEAAMAYSAMIAGAASGALSGGNPLNGAIRGAVFAGLSYSAGTIAERMADASYSAFAVQGTKAGLHAMIGCAEAASAGGSCKSGALSAGVAAGFTPEFNDFGKNLIARTAVGAVASALGGGHAGQGAVLAAFGYLFNDCAHGECSLFDKLEEATTNLRAQECIQGCHGVAADSSRRPMFPDEVEQLIQLEEVISLGAAGISSGGLALTRSGVKITESGVARISEQIVFKTEHYGSRLEAGGVNVLRAESAVTKEIVTIRSNLAPNADIAGRLRVDGALLEYRMRLFPNGSVNVGTIFPVK